MYLTSGIYFFVSLISLGLFGETFLDLIIFNLLAFFGLILILRLRKEAISSFNYNLFFILSSIVVLGAISTIVTHSVPDTLGFIYRNAFYLVFFFQFQTIVGVFLNKYGIERVRNDVLKVIIFSVLSLSVFSLFFQLFNLNLPNLNLLTQEYGHNHFIALLVLTIPLTIGLLLKEKNKHLSLLYLAAFIFQVFFAFFSNSRLGLIIVISQLLFISITNRHLIYKKTKGLQKKHLGLLLVLALVSIAFFTAITFKECGAINDHSCKNFAYEARPEYFTQAVRAIYSYPIWGYGAGTFNLISHKYAIKPGSITSYSHNSLLQFTAELGIGGGLIFIALLLNIIKKPLSTVFSIAVSEVRGKSNTSDLFLVAISTSLLASTLYSFFDFDWNFSAIYILVLFLSSVINAFSNQRKPDSFKSSYVYTVCTGIYSFAHLGLFILLALYLISEGILYFLGPSKALHFFPYFSQHKLIYYGVIHEPTSKDKIFHIWKNDPLYYFHLENSGSYEIDNIIRRIEIDPFNLNNVDTYLLKMLAQDERTKIFATLAHLNKTTQKYWHYYSLIVSQEDLEIMAKVAEITADRQFADNNLKESINLYLESLKLFSMQLSINNPQILSSSKDQIRTNFSSFEHFFDTIHIDKLGKNSEKFSKLYLKFLEVKIENGMKFSLEECSRYGKFKEINWGDNRNETVDKFLLEHNPCFQT